MEIVFGWANKLAENLNSRFKKKDSCEFTSVMLSIIFEYYNQPLIFHSKGTRDYWITVPLVSHSKPKV